MLRLGSGAAYRMIFSKRYTFDALCGLTVGLERAAHVAVWGVIRHWDIQLDAKKRTTTATDNCFKVGHVCNVVLERQLLVVHYISCHVVHAVSTFCIANMHSQTSKALRKTNIIIIMHNC